MPVQDPKDLLDQSDIICSADEVQSAINQMAVQINQAMTDPQPPLVLCVMGGAVFFAGQLLPRLNFPLEFDYVQVSRYHNQTEGKQLIWKVMPSENVKGRTVLVLDDILDQGHTLKAIKEKCLQLGAGKVLIAVMVDKALVINKPISADFTGLTVPDRYVFGCGMDVYGWWRNLPAIHALQ